MSSGAIAALAATLALGFVEGMARFYPAHQTWVRLRRRHGRRAVRRMRERFEEAAGKRTPRRLASFMVVLVLAWVAVARLLDKRWYELALDLLPYLIVAIALLRTPHMMGRVAQRMRGYESDAGEDPDEPLNDPTEGGGGPTAVSI